MSQRKFKLLRREAAKHRVPYKVAKKFMRTLTSEQRKVLLTRQR